MRVLPVVFAALAFTACGGALKPDGGVATDCGAHGHCATGTTCDACACDTGYAGDLCNACGDGYDGPSCSSNCGNGEVAAGEACDDGNVTSGDGCSATCQVEPDDEHTLGELYVFREHDQSAGDAAGQNLIVLLTMGMTLPRTQSFFDVDTRITLHVGAAGTQATDLSKRGQETLALQFTFGVVAADGSQPISAKVLPNGGAVQDLGVIGNTTPQPKGLGANLPTWTPQTFRPTLNGSTRAIDLVAGIFGDPLFFDASQYQRFLSGNLQTGLGVSFRTPNQAVDIAKDLNSRGLALRIPIAALQTDADTIFDFSATLERSLSGGRAYSQVAYRGQPQLAEMLFELDSSRALYATLSGAAQLAAVTGNGALAVEVNASLVAVNGSGDLERIPDERLAYFPDTLRVNTTIVSPVGSTAFGHSALVIENGVVLTAPSGSVSRTQPVWVWQGGRKIEDDVIDAWLKTFSDDEQHGDGVGYTDTNSPGAGHPPLTGQSAPPANADTSGFAGNHEGGNATFPFLSRPN